MKFESWDDLNEFLSEASASQLHDLAVKHADCWSKSDFCEEDEMLWEDTEDLREIILPKIVGMPNVGLETIELALNCGWADTWHRAFMSSCVMGSPAVTTEILKEIPIDDLVDDGDVARDLYFHRLADLDVLLYVINGFPLNLIDNLVAEEFRELGAIVESYSKEDQKKRVAFRQELLGKFEVKWNQVNQEGRKATLEEQSQFDAFLDLAKSGL